MPVWTKAHDGTTQVSFVLFDRFSNHVFANALEPLRAANTILNSPGYAWEILTLDGGTVSSSAGMKVMPDGRLDGESAGDILVVLPSYGYRDFATVTLTRALRAARSRFKALAGIDGGAWLLASAGLLDGRRATIHFDEQDAFAEAFPDVIVTRDRWIDDGDRMTASGAVTAFELMLALIEREHGAALPLRIASLFSANDADTAGPLLPKGRDQRVRLALAAMEAAIETPRPIAEIATDAGCTQKDLEHRFRQAFGAPPRTVYAHLRMGAAKRMVEESALPVAEIAGRAGYDNASAFTRAYRRAFGVSPRQARSGRPA